MPTPITVSLKSDCKTADKIAKINSDGQASCMTARPHTTSSARVPQDRTQDRTGIFPALYPLIEVGKNNGPLLIYLQFNYYAILSF